jgi:rsbT antagonist protein RsbS
MDVPILKQGPYLIASIQSALDDADLRALRDNLVARVGTHRSNGVIVDVTALDVMDSYASLTLSDIAHMTRLRGAETVIVGIEGVATALDLEEGLDFLKRKARDAGKQAGAPGR